MYVPVVEPPGTASFVCASAGAAVKPAASAIAPTNFSNAFISSLLVAEPFALTSPVPARNQCMMVVPCGVESGGRARDAHPGYRFLAGASPRKRCHMTYV